MGAGKDSFEAVVDWDELTTSGRKIAEIEWLSLALVLLYAQLAGAAGLTPSLIWTIIAYAVFVIAFHYLLTRRVYNQVRLSVDIGAMIAFSTAAVWFTGGLESPLLPLYFLPVGVSALMVSQKAALGTAGAVTLCCIGLGYASFQGEGLNVSLMSRPATALFALWLVAYLAALLVGEKNAAKRKAARLAQIDELTGLWNMRMFNRLAEKELKRSSRYRRPFSIAMIDADNLKSVNDTYGHWAGGLFIQHLANCLRKHMRESDVLARYGGDEFVVLFPETDSGEAREALDRLRETIRSSPLQIEGSAISITVCIGVATYPEHGDDVQKVLRKADAAMYRGKETGKNRVEIATDGAPPESTGATPPIMP